MNNNASAILDALENQLNHRLTKLWNVFSWSSGILVSITGGIITLKKIKSITLEVTEQYILTGVIIVFTLYAWLMIKENLKYEGKIRDQIDILMKDDFSYPQFKELRPDKAVFGYKHVVLLLGIAALATIWVDILKS